MCKNRDMKAMSLRKTHWDGWKGYRVEGKGA